MCDYKKGSRIKTGVFFCDRVLVFASHIRYNDRKLFQRERRKTVMKKIVFATGNAGKMKEIREILADLPVEIYSMKEAGPIFYLPDMSRTTAELSPEEKNAVSHRGKALAAMKEQIASYLK